jgi:hypothetical protein
MLRRGGPNADRAPQFLGVDSHIWRNGRRRSLRQATDHTLWDFSDSDVKLMSIPRRATGFSASFKNKASNNWGIKSIKR